MSGGQERYILQVGNGLLERGHEVRLVFGSVGEESLDTSLTKFRTDLIAGLNLESVSKYVREFGPDVINLQNVYEVRLIALLNSNYPVTRFVHDHTTYCPGSSKYFFNSGQICPIAASGTCLLNAYREKCMTRRPGLAISRVVQRRSWLNVLKTLPLVLCNSTYVKRRLIQNGLSSGRIVVNGLFPGHPETFGLEHTLRPERDKINILFVGRLFKEKGVNLLIDAISKVSRPVRLVVAGDGWEKEALVGLADSLGVGDKVTFLGFQSSHELRELYSQCDIFVMPSVWPEPFGMVGLEAGLFRKPVISFNVGGVSDWLTDGENGLLLSKPDLNLLTEAINKLSADPDLRQRLGDNGFSRVKSQFNLERHLNVLEESYLKLTK
jgi:glycosyltransferase involved in cell wall biosynthesis